MKLLCELSLLNCKETSAKRHEYMFCIVLVVILFAFPILCNVIFCTVYGFFFVISRHFWRDNFVTSYFVLFLFIYINL